VYTREEYMARVYGRRNFRVRGEFGDVAKKSLLAILGLIIAFAIGMVIYYMFKTEKREELRLPSVKLGVPSPKIERLKKDKELKEYEKALKELSKEAEKLEKENRELEEKLEAARAKRMLAEEYVRERNRIRELLKERENLLRLIQAEEEAARRIIESGGETTTTKRKKRRRRR